MPTELFWFLCFYYSLVARTSVDWRSDHLHSLQMETNFWNFHSNSEAVPVRDIEFHFVNTMVSVLCSRRNLLDHNHHGAIRIWWLQWTQVEMNYCWFLCIRLVLYAKCSDDNRAFVRETFCSNFFFRLKIFHGNFFRLNIFVSNFFGTLETETWWSSLDLWYRSSSRTKFYSKSKTKKISH